MEKQCPARGGQQPRHLVPCLPWHGWLAQVGLSRERPEAQPADPPGGQRGSQDRGSVELGGRCMEEHPVQLHTGPALQPTGHCSPNFRAPLAVLQEKNHTSRGPQGETAALRILEASPKESRKAGGGGGSGGGGGDPRPLEPWPGLDAPRPKGPAPSPQRHTHVASLKRAPSKPPLSQSL